jgi:hypothetical protein
MDVMQEPAEDETAFDRVLSVWPGADLIGDRWRDGPRHAVVIEGVSEQWMLGAVVESFPTVRPGADMAVVVCPKFVAQICAWVATEHGPYVDIEPSEGLGVPAEVADAELAAAVATIAAPVPFQLDHAEVLGEFATLVQVAARHGVDPCVAAQVATAVDDGGVDLVALDASLQLLVAQRPVGV